MKKIFALFLIPLVLAGCKKDDGTNPTTEPVILLAEGSPNMSVPAGGGTVSVTYTITNPVDGGQISAASSETWIDGFNYDTENTIIFDVAVNELTEARSSILTVVYTYDGGEVQAQMNIVQEGSVPYDYVPELTEFSGIYYGTQYGVNGEYNFYTWISDMPFQNGEIQAGGTYYLFDIFAPAPEDESNPRPAAGTYTLGEAKATAEMTFTPDYSQGISSTAEGNLVFNATVADGILTISYEGDNMILDASLTLTDGTTHHVTYNGPCEYEIDIENGGGGTIGSLTEDLDIDAGIAVASYLAEAGNIMEVSIQLTDMDVDEYGYVIPPGSMLTIDAIMPYDEDGNIATGEYTVSEDLTEFTVYPGELIWDMYQTGTYATYYPDDQTYLDGYVASGTMTVSGNADNLTISCDFYTADGISIKASYTGPLSVSNMPGPFSTLTGDYTLNLDGATASATFYGDYYGTGGGNWWLTMMPTTGTDGFQTDFVVTGTSFADGITSGSYTAAAGNYPAPGEYLTGYMDGNSLGGTMYIGGFNSDGHVTQYAPATSGTMQITNNGDGTYRIVMDFVDDKGNNWDGEWEGTITLTDGNVGYAPRRVGSGVLAPVNNTISQENRVEYFSNLPIKTKAVVTPSVVRPTVGK